MEGDEGQAKSQAAANWRQSALFDAEERLALDYAERMTITGQRVDATLFARLKARFSKAQLVELTPAIALENFRSKFNPAFSIEALKAFASLRNSRN
jgi:alkylhydroperoxidase family enzyme